MSEQYPYKKADPKREGARRAYGSASFADAGLGTMSLLRAPLFLACFLLGAGMGMQLSAPVLASPFNLFTALLSGIASVIAAIFFRERDANQRVFIGICVFFAISFLVSTGAVFQVLASVANAFIEAWDAFNDAYILPFALEGAVTSQDLVAAIMFMVSLAVFAIWLLLMIRKPAFSMAAIMAMIIIGAFCHIATAMTVILLFSGGMLLVALQTMIDNQSASIGRKSIEGFISVVPGFLLSVCAIGLICVMGIGAQGISGEASTIRDTVLSAVNEMRFGSDTLPEGDFSKASYMNEQQAGGPYPRIEVDFGDPDNVERMYFRGYAGTQYIGHSMNQPSAAIYTGKWNGIFSWADAMGFDPLMQNALYTKVNAEELGSDVSSGEVTITAKEANRKYSYAPYQVESASSTTQLLDLYLQPSGFAGLEQSNMTVVRGSMSSELFTPADWLAAADESSEGENDFAEAEMAYRAFANDAYTKIDDDVRDTVDEFFYSGRRRKEIDDSLYAVVSRIRAMLESECVYSSQPEPYSPTEDGDYIEWFLKSSKQGNAVPFAVAAVMAFREAGVPSRYVEGYYLGGANIDALRDAGQSKATLTELQAHAWPEVYIDGLGWTPIEVVPGFYDKSYSAEHTIEIIKEVASDGSESEISGSIDRSWEDLIPENLRPFAWIGLILLIAIFLLLVFAVLEIQRYLRLQWFKAKMRRALDCAEAAPALAEIGLSGRIDPGASALLFNRLEQVIRYAPFPFDASAPEKCEDEVVAFCEMRPEEYRRIVDLLKRERFGAIPINDHEADLIIDTILRTESAFWENAPMHRRLLMRYKSLFMMPLAHHGS